MTLLARHIRPARARIPVGFQPLGRIQLSLPANMLGLCAGSAGETRRHQGRVAGRP